MNYKLPSPAPERSSVRGRRQKIVARLDSLSEKIGKIKKLQSTTQNDFIALEQFLLQQAFAGHAILLKAFTAKQHSNIL